MPRKKNDRKPQEVGTTTKNRTVHAHWVWIGLVAGLLFGGMSGYFVGQAASAAGRGLVADGYGRMPGNPHYMHNHP